MSIRALLFLLAFLAACVAVAQKKTVSNAGLEASVSGSQGSVAIYCSHGWLIGKRKNFEIGPGARLTTYAGHNQYYQTAPASLVSGGGVNVDSLLVSSPVLYSLNLMLSAIFRTAGKLSAGLTIDITGVSFGSTKSATYLHNGQPANTQASPTSFNLLLIDNNDHGTLNSQFFASYALSEKWAVKAGVMHLFTEYTTSTEVQQLPSANDRFRNKTTMFSAGMVYRVK